ncbi:MAG: hypothetical protein OCU22_03775 [Canidatus Methanoxibalbensis ujae]|nr:hypothetical protein [Candidatus Methanoxibalbensis ujae]
MAVIVDKGKRAVDLKHALTLRIDGDYLICDLGERVELFAIQEDTDEASLIFYLAQVKHRDIVVPYEELLKDCQRREDKVKQLEEEVKRLREELKRYK